jgi:hypothetical protein
MYPYFYNFPGIDGIEYTSPSAILELNKLVLISTNALSWEADLIGNIDFAQLFESNFSFCFRFRFFFY